MVLYKVLCTSAELGEEVFSVPSHLVILGSMARAKIRAGLLRGKGEFAPIYTSAVEQWMDGLGTDGNLHHIVATFLLTEHANRGFFAPYVDGLPAKTVRDRTYSRLHLWWKRKKEQLRRPMLRRG